MKSTAAGLWFATVMCMGFGAIAAESVPYPAHVVTDAQKDAWRIGWPRWNGPLSCGAGIDCGYTLVDDYADATVVWKGEEPIPNSELQPLRSGYCSPVVAAGRVYLFYGWPHGLDVEAVMATRDRSKERGDLFDATTAVADDIVVCADATTGKTLWKRTFEKLGARMERSGKSGGNYTMCIHGGKAYAIGATTHVYCMDAVTGESVWDADLKSLAWKGFPNGCPVVAEVPVEAVPAGKPMAVLGVLKPDDRKLYGFNADTGERLWETKGAVGGGVRNGSSPLVWQAKDRQYFVVNKTCVDPRDGKILWTLPGNSGGVCLSVVGDYAVTEADGADAAFKITPDGATLAWTLGSAYPINGFSMPVIYRDHAYIMTWTAKDEVKAQRKFPTFAVACVEMATGKVVGEASTGKFNMYQAVAAEQRFTYANYLAKADPTDCRQLSMLSGRDFDMAQDTSAAYACGWLFRRGKEGLLCIDLRQKSK